MSSCLDTARLEADPAATVHYRPAIHFTARDTWLNDPNGLVYHDGLYHLFFQNNPFANVWGNMSWGHATSKDLVHWTEHPVAIPCDEVEDIFSGSVVVDHHNTSGFGDAGKAPLVAVYTSAYKEPSPYSGTQAQSLAYSTDGGMTWKKYESNPVLTRGSANFRDPKVFRYSGQRGSWWVMVAVEAQEQKVVLYRSDDLRSWELLSEFGPANADGGEWECPDLFPLAVDGDRERVKWVLIVNINPGSVAGGSGGQYFVGEFDGVTFVPDAASLAAPSGISSTGGEVGLGDCLWLDWGRDCYASVSFSDLPDDRCIIIGWMSNWDYANHLPTYPWRSGMTLARELSLVTIEDQPRLVQRPVLPPGGNVIRSLEQVQLLDDVILLGEAVIGRAQVLDVDVLPGAGGAVGLTLLGSRTAGTGTVVRYDAAERSLTLDRRQSGNTFHAAFPSAESVPVSLDDDGALRLRVVVDHCSVEVFAQDGRVAITDLVFPEEGSRELSVFCEGAAATIRSLTVTELS